MKCLFTLIFSLLCFGTAWGQSNAKTDSLERVIATTKVDTVRGVTLCKLCEELRILGEYRTAIAHAKEGLRINEQQKYAPGIALCLNQIGIVHWAKGEWDDGLVYFHKSLTICEKEGNQRKIGGCLINIGMMYANKGDHKKAVEYYQKGINTLEKIGEQLYTANGYNNLAVIYLDQAHYPKALECFLKSLAINEKIGNQAGIANNYSNLGILYRELKEYQRALTYYQKSLQIAREQGNKKTMANVLDNMANVCTDLKQYDSALKYLNEVIEIRKYLEDNGAVAYAYNNMGNIYSEQKKYSEALKYLRLSKNAIAIHSKKEKDDKALSGTYVNLGKAFLRSGQFDSARYYSYEGLQSALRIKRTMMIVSGAEILSQTDSALGNWKSAYEYQKLFKQYTDTLTNEDKAKAIGKLQAEYEFNKEREASTKQALEDAEKRKLIYYLIGSGVSIIMLLTGFIFYRYRAKAKLNRALQDINEELASKNEEILTQRDELAVRNEEITTQRDELAAQADQIVEQRDELDKAYHKIETAFRKLKELDEFKEAMSGMIVHDLKNPLNAIIGISNKPVMTTSDQIAIRQAGKHMLNLTLNFLDVQKFEQAQVPLHLKDEALLHIVHDAIEQVSLLIANKNLQLSISIEPTTGVFCDFDLISRVLMNIFTNAIKYTPNNGSITINAEETPDNHIQIAVSDTGQGIPADKLDTVFDKFSQVEARKSGTARSTGLGLTFCKLTVESHGGHIWVESEVGVGTTFYFTLAKALNEVKAVQPIILPAHNAVEINLTAEDQARLQPFLEKLQAFDVYEAGEILKIIAPIPDTPALSVWKTELERTIFASNQERYKELLGRF